jgi:threonine dehydratase
MQIHAFDQPETLLGQGSVGLEIEADLPETDTLLVATGGGGLIGGIAAWFAGRIRIVAVEPEGAPTLFKALAAGRPVDAETEGIAADSLAPKQVGQLMFPLAQAYVERSVWWPTTTSAPPSAPSGKVSGWWSSRAVPPPWRPCCRANTGRRRANGWRCCCAAPIPRPSISAENQGLGPDSGASHFSVVT